MIDFNRNNLDKSNSPYLRQHKDNPIHWQEWSRQTLDWAKDKQKLIFASVGYATCHWCHVMAREAFSDLEVADFLNKHFVSIKVDREQRPDIDEYFMNFLVETSGSGGWPMNVFLTPDGKPFFAGTYFPLQPILNRPGFKQILQQTLDWYKENSQNIKPFATSRKPDNQIDDGQVLIKLLIQQFDYQYGGWGKDAKFPPYNTLIFLLNYLTKDPSKKTREMILMTLDQMIKGGLHDHLQGGFFRYCVDREWRIPHFEKMLYDQAMLLWVYSLGFQMSKKDLYKSVAEKLIAGLDQVFLANDLYYSATDADTNHQEGATYLWSKEEIQKILTSDQWQEFIKVYDLSEQNSLENKYHLVKKSTKKILPEIEKKLLQTRNNRPQPTIDKKIITSWNALLGIAFFIAGRYLNEEVYIKKGLNLYQKLLKKHFINGELAHSSLENSLQDRAFLQDWAAFLLLATYVHEQYQSEEAQIKKLKTKLMDFYQEEKWMESLKSKDFNQVEASLFDHPTPSSISLAEEALRRSAIILGDIDQRTLNFKIPLVSDFYNLVVFYKMGNFHEIHTPIKINNNLLPVNNIQLKGDEYQDCFEMQCKRYTDESSLLAALGYILQKPY